MKNLTNILIIALTAMLLYSGTLFSQEVSKDSLKAGKVYKILLADDSWIVGEVTGIDSVNIHFKKTSGRTTVLYKEHIKTILLAPPELVTEYYKKMHTNKTLSKSFFTAGGGLVLLGIFSGGEYENTPNTYVIDGECVLYFSRSEALRININYNFTGSSYSIPYYDAGNTSVYLFSFDVLSGNLKPESKTNQYFTGGLSLLIYSESDYHSESSYLFGPKLGYGIKHKASPNLMIGGEILYATPFQYLMGGVFSIRPSLNVKVSENLGIYAEPQYTFPVAFGDGGGFYFDSGFLTVKAGISYNLF